LQRHGLEYRKFEGIHTKETYRINDSAMLKGKRSIYKNHLHLYMLTNKFENEVK
jgi:hypothetical protein